MSNLSLIKYMIIGYVISVVIAYPIGYLLFDYLGWITADTLKEANIHVIRYFIGCLILIIPISFILIKNKTDEFKD